MSYHNSYVTLQKQLSDSQEQALGSTFMGLTECINLTSFGGIKSGHTYLKQQKSQLGSSKVHNVASLEWSTPRHTVGGAVGGYCSTLSLFSCMSISPPFSQTKGKRPSFPAVLTGVLSIGHKPLAVTTARQNDSEHMASWSHPTALEN